MEYNPDNLVWAEKGGTLSEKNAQKEYGLSYEEIKEAAEAGKIRWQRAYAHGNPYNKLVRCDVEALVREKQGQQVLDTKRIETELDQIESRLRSLIKQRRDLEKRRDELRALLRT